LKRAFEPIKVAAGPHFFLIFAAMCALAPANLSRVQARRLGAPKATDPVLFQEARLQQCYSGRGRQTARQDQQGRIASAKLQCKQQPCP